MGELARKGEQYGMGLQTIPDTIGTSSKMAEPGWLLVRVIASWFSCLVACTAPAG